MIKPIQLRKIFVYPFPSKDILLDGLANLHGILIAINAEKILNNDNNLIKIINSNYGYADGIGAVKGLRKKGIKNVTKIPGCELWLDIIRKFSQTKSFYFVGSSDTVINNTINKLHTEFPEINIVNYRNGYINENDKEKLITDLKEKKPEVIFVAMGSPRQEYLMNELFQEHKALYMGLGGSFDVYTGYVKRAPKIFIRLGVEWLYRLLKQPTRIKRQIRLVNFFFMLHAGRL